MKAAVLTGLREMEIRDVPAPAIERDSDVLIRIGAVGICGSDVHNYARGGIGEERVAYPFIPGHEASGTVAAVGPAVTRVKPGDRIVVEPAMPCGECDQCLCGRWNTCRKMTFASAPGQSQGLMCEQVVMPETNCFPLPDKVSLQEGAFCEPLSIAVYAVRLSIPMAGASVAVLGAGPIGLSVLLAARAEGARRVYVTDRLNARVEVARRTGADWAGNPDEEDVITAILEREPLEIDVVFDCCGKPEADRQGIAMLKPGGKLVIVGIPEEDDIALPCHDMRRRELTLVNVRRQRDCVEPAIELIAGERADVQPLITHRFPLDQAPEALELVNGYEDGVVKAMVVMG